MSSAASQSVSFDVPLGDNAESNLQEAFLRYKKKKQDELRARLRSEQQDKAERSDPDRMAALRAQFLQTALSYTGIPYAKRYHDPESPTHHAEMFLDCCGLVRRVVKDLHDEFGFDIGPWNQAYMFDTLPIALGGPQDMQPGDLVFVSAIYYNPKAKKQHHNMVHVEIWMGEGDKTLGARWQRGRVQIHESYQFVSKSYHSMEFHFRSIDTWLAGECKSHCPEHPWSVRKFNPGKHSVFALNSDDEECCNAYSEQEEEEEEDIRQPLSQPSVAPCDEPSQSAVTGSSNEATHPGKMAAQAPTTDTLCESTAVQGPAAPESMSLESPAANTPPEKMTVQGPSGNKAVLVKTKSSSSVKSALARTFITCGGNAATLVERSLVARGWLKLEDKSSQSFTLKWVEVKKHIDYKNFREGEQMVNRFPNISLLSTKTGLLESLRSYSKMHRSRVKLEKIVPLTYRMDVASEREEFYRNFKDGELWICKPTGANQGKGIFLVRDLQQLKDKLQADQSSTRLTSRPPARIVQRYIANPLLLEGRKFDIRVYLLVVAAQPWLAFHRDGYIRLCCSKFEMSSDNLSVHLTNQYQQKKCPQYSEVKEDTVWDMNKFQDYLHKEHAVAEDWVATVLTKRIRTVMGTCFNSIRHKLSHTIGYFDLLGFDFMLDQDFNLWLIEVNENPALHTNCDTLAEICPSVLEETLDIAIEVFDKCRRNRPLLPVNAIKHFSMIISS